MGITKEQIEEIKKQLINQINSTFSEDKKEDAIKQVQEMNEEQFMIFLEQNNLIKELSESGQNPKEQCIFCSIVFNETPSTKIFENEEAIAILELNPISKAHTLIIPKNHLSSEKELTPKIHELEKQVKEKIQKIFNPQKIESTSGNIMGHQIINLIPVYTNENINSQRKNSTPEELSGLKKQIDSFKENKIEETKDKELPKIKRRIP